MKAVTEKAGWGCTPPNFRLQIFGMVVLPRQSKKRKPRLLAVLLQFLVQVTVAVMSSPEPLMLTEKLQPKVDPSSS